MADEIVLLRGRRHIVWECRTCGVTATCPEIVYDQHRKEGGYHTCPNGHQWGWSNETCEREKLRRERDLLKQQMVQKDDELRDLENRRQAAVSEATKLRKRISNGVCPCCNRTFTNIARHMASKHPEFKALGNGRGYPATR